MILVFISIAFMILLLINYNSTPPQHPKSSTTLQPPRALQPPLIQPRIPPPQPVQQPYINLIAAFANRGGALERTPTAKQWTEAGDYRLGTLGTYRYHPDSEGMTQPITFPSPFTGGGPKHP